MLTLSGCSQKAPEKKSPPQPIGETTNNTPTPSPTTNPTPAPAPSPTPTPSPSPTTNPTPTPAPAPTVSADSYTNKGYKDLLEVPIPLSCKVRMTTSGITVDARVYIKAKNMVRVEVDFPSQASCKQILSIYNTDKVYTSCTDGVLYPSSKNKDCKWLGVSATATNSLDSDLSKVPPADISCTPWTVDDSKFDIVGRVCSISEII